MCGRFVQYSHPEVYASQFDLDAFCEAPPRYNLAPTQPVLAIRCREGAGRVLVPLRWGLVPAWSKGPDHRYSMINARAESVSSKPAYRKAFRHRRCLIPAEGFYEWKAENGAKTPFLIQRKDGAPFAMAGLWERWHGADGSDLESCTIIVTDANDLVSRIHDRMPVILSPQDFEAWLDPEMTDTNRLMDLLRPTDPDPWTLHPVSRQVNSPRNDGPELLTPVEA
ncbi:MAG: SOS response-associated peptidase [Bdellovibrio bacteriovorus]